MKRQTSFLKIVCWMLVITMLTTFLPARMVSAAEKEDIRGTLKVCSNDEIWQKHVSFYSANLPNVTLVRDNDPACADWEVENSQGIMKPGAHVYNPDTGESADYVVTGELCAEQLLNGLVTVLKDHQEYEPQVAFLQAMIVVYAEIHVTGEIDVNHHFDDIHVYHHYDGAVPAEVQPDRRQPVETTGTCVQFSTETVNQKGAEWVGYLNKEYGIGTELIGKDLGNGEFYFVLRTGDKTIRDYTGTVPSGWTKKWTEETSSKAPYGHWYGFYIAGTEICGYNGGSNVSWGSCYPRVEMWDWIMTVSGKSDGVIAKYMSEGWWGHFRRCPDYGYVQNYDGPLLPGMTDNTHGYHSSDGSGPLWKVQK